MLEADAPGDQDLNDHDDPFGWAKEPDEEADAELNPAGD